MRTNLSPPPARGPACNGDGDDFSRTRLKSGGSSAERLSNMTLAASAGWVNRTVGPTPADACAAWGAHHPGPARSPSTALRIGRCTVV